VSRQVIPRACVVVIHVVGELALVAGEGPSAGEFVEQEEAHGA
jgi:hypothetical protein